MNFCFEFLRFQKKLYHKLTISKKKSPEKEIQIFNKAYNIKGCLRFSNFIFWTLSNLAKYTYGWSPIEQHHKIEK
jgi:hypothetical protein